MMAPFTVMTPKRRVLLFLVAFLFCFSQPAVSAAFQVILGQPTPLRTKCIKVSRSFSSLSSSSSGSFSRNDNESYDNNNNKKGRENSLLRLNKVFKATHSRREADRMIQEGRVSVNGIPSYGCMVTPFQDVVTLDGKVVHGWEQMNSLVAVQVKHENDKRDSSSGSNVSKPRRNVLHSDTVVTPIVDSGLEYVKYWKPRGIICTTDRRIKGNIMDEITQHGGYRPSHRVYPVGRLDKDSSGLILLTSDGRLPNASLRQNQKQPKVYHVQVDRALVDQDIDRLQQGIVITTVAQRDGTAKALTARTKPCLVTRMSMTSCEITLTEGRNRQIRKMMDALGYRVLELNRVRFGEISLGDIRHEGEWKRLDRDEMRWIEKILQGDTESSKEKGLLERG